MRKWPEADAHLEYLRQCEKRILDYDARGDVAIQASLDQQLAAVRQDLWGWNILAKLTTRNCRCTTEPTQGDSEARSLPNQEKETHKAQATP